MKKITFLPIILLSLCLVITTSCNKLDDPTIGNPETEELLSANNWVKESITYTEGGQDATGFFETTFQNIYISFNDNGTYSITSSNLGVLSSGTWSINEAGDVITVIDQDSNTIIINILSITETSLHVTFTYISEGYITINVDIDVTLVPDVN